MSSSWWNRRASASDTANPPRTTIRTARSFDPSQPSTSSTPTRSRTTSNAGAGGLTVTIASALGLGGSSLSKSKSRERLRGIGTSSQPESRAPPTQPSLIHTATFFASGAGAAPVIPSSSSRRAPKSSIGSSSLSRVPNPNRTTVVSTESGSSWAATSSSAEPIDQQSMWEPATPSSGSEAKNSFQSIGMAVGEDPFARAAPAPVWVSKGKAPEVAEKPRKKEKTRERRLGVSAGSAGMDDGSVSPLSLSPMSAFPVPPDSLGYLTSPVLPRRAASALAAGPSSGISRPTPQRSHSAQPRPGTSPNLGYSPRTPTSPPLPPTQPLPLTPPMQTLPLAPSPGRLRTSPSLRVDACSSVQMHAHASALQDSESVMGASVYCMGEIVSDEEDGYEVRLREPVSRSRGGCPIGTGMGMGSMTALASGIVTGLEEQVQGVRKGSAGQLSIGSNSSSGGGGRVPPKRPSRSELRKQPSTNSLRTSSNTIVPPVRQSSLQPQASLYPAPRRAVTDGPGGLSVVSASGSGSGSSGSGSGLSVSPSTSNGSSPTVSSVTTPNGSNVTTPNGSTVTTPNASSLSVQRSRTRDTTPTGEQLLTPLSAGPFSGPSSAGSLSSPSYTGPSTTLPSIPTSPPPRVSEESTVDLENYVFAPINDTDSASVELTDENGHEIEESSQWLSWPVDDGIHLGAGSTPQRIKYGRRPPPSPTNLPWMAGNAGRRPTRRDVVYPSGVHVIPMAAMSDLARLGKEEDAVVARTVVEEEVEPSPLHPPLSSIEEKFPTPPASAPPSSPSPIHPLTRLSSMSTGSRTSSCSSLSPEVVPPESISSRVEFSRHVRTGSYSDSELDFDDKRPRAPGKTKFNHSGSLLPQTTTDSTTTSTSVVWRCASGGSQKCCGTRSMAEGPNTGGWKCCAERAHPGTKNARCCASFVGRPCERPRVSSTSSASVHEAAKALKRQRSFHLSSLPGIGPIAPVPVPSPSGGASAPGKQRNRFFHRPHTSHGKSTSYGLVEDDSRSVRSVKSKEDPGPSGSISAVLPEDVFGPRPTVVSPPMSPLGKHEFKAQYILAPAKLNDHLKEARVSSPAPVVPPPVEPVVVAGLRSPRLEPVRQRSNTTTTAQTDASSSHRSIMSTHSTDSPLPMRSLLPPRRVHNTSLPSLSSTQTVEQPRRYVRSVSTVSSSSGPPPPPRSPGIMPTSAPANGSGLPPPPRGRVGMQPIVSFISSRSAPTPRASEVPGMAGLSLKHRTSRESYESSSTVRRERVMPMSFLEIEVEEEEDGEEDEEEDGGDEVFERPGLQHSQSFLDLSVSRQSGDTMRENEAMFS